MSKKRKNCKCVFSNLFRCFRIWKLQKCHNVRLQKLFWYTPELIFSLIETKCVTYFWSKSNKWYTLKVETWTILWCFTMKIVSENHVPDALLQCNKRLGFTTQKTLYEPINGIFSLLFPLIFGLFQELS